MIQIEGLEKISGYKCVQLVFHRLVRRFRTRVKWVNIKTKVQVQDIYTSAELMTSDPLAHESGTDGGGRKLKQVVITGGLELAVLVDKRMLKLVSGRGLVYFVRSMRTRDDTINIMPLEESK